MCLFIPARRAIGFNKNTAWTSLRLKKILSLKHNKLKSIIIIILLLYENIVYMSGTKSNPITDVSLKASSPIYNTVR